MQAEDDTVLKELVYLTNYRERFGEYPSWNQSPSSFKRYLPSNNPQGLALIRYDRMCQTWLPPALRLVEAPHASACCIDAP